jgi:predicted CXXCH cytochrome family protein
MRTPQGLRKITLCCTLFLCMFFLLASCAPEMKPRRGFKPKPCLECHTEMLKELDKQNVHAPMRNRDCEACHIRHGKIAFRSLKERVEKKLCFLCHSEMASKIKEIPFEHTVLKEGKCIPCHGPHASDNTSLQKIAGNEQCFTCHDKAPFQRSKRHKPLDDGCLTCHDPHGSGYQSNLVQEETALCRTCHNYEIPRSRVSSVPHATYLHQTPSP